MLPKPKKADRSRRRTHLGPSDKTKQLKRLYRMLVRPAFLAGLSAGQGRRGRLPICERCNLNPVLAVHHMQGRTGELVIEPAKLAGLCEACHADVHANPEEAYGEGWLIRRHGAPVGAMDLEE